MNRGILDEVITWRNESEGSIFGGDGDSQDINERRIGSFDTHNIVCKVTIIVTT